MSDIERVVDKDLFGLWLRLVNRCATVTRFQEGVDDIHAWLVKVNELRSLLGTGRADLSTIRRDCQAIEARLA